MAMRYMDSCDHYDESAYIGLKWTGNVLGGESVPNGRNGRGIAPGAGVIKTLDYQASWVIGFAYNPENTGKWLHSIIYYLSATNVNTMLTLVVEDDGTLSLYGGNNLNLIGNTAGNFSLHQNTWNYFEVKSELSGTMPISVLGTLRVNGVTLIEGTAETGWNATDTLLGLGTANVHGFTGGGTVDSVPICDDFYIAAIDGTGSVNDFAGDLQLGVLFPRADVTMDWTAVGGDTATGWDHVNEQFAEANDDTIYIEDNNAGDKVNFEWQPVSPFTGAIIAVHYGVLNRKDQEGTRTFQQYAQGSYFNGPITSPGDAYDYTFYAMDEDPATSMPWTQDGFNAATFGIKLIS